MSIFLVVTEQNMRWLHPSFYTRSTKSTRDVTLMLEDLELFSRVLQVHKTIWSNTYRIIFNGNFTTTACELPHIHVTGSRIYQEKLAMALAHHVGAKLLVLGNSFFPAVSAKPFQF